MPAATFWIPPIFIKSGTSEKIIGEFVSSRDRDQFVIATKYSLYDNYQCKCQRQQSQKHDAQRRSQPQTVKHRLYGCIVPAHLGFFNAGRRGAARLDDLVSQGKINYAAISDTPAWIVAKANTMAGLMGWSKLIALQIEYSLLQRAPERDLLPMAKHFGMTVMPWAPLAGGALTGKYLRGERGRLKEGSNRLNERSERITKEVIAVAKELGVQPSQVALKWTMQKDFQCIPIAGATRLDQLQDNLKAVEVILPAEAIERLNKVSTIELGFPHDFFNEEAVQKNNFGGFYTQIEKR